MDKGNYTLSELSQRAKDDPSWEESAETRIELVNALFFQLLNSIT